MRRHFQSEVLIRATLSWSLGILVLTSQLLLAHAQTWVDHFGSSTGGGISATAEASSRPVVAMGSNGLIATTWINDLPGSEHVYLRQSLNSPWIGLGGSASGTGIDGQTRGLQPDVSVDAAGRILVSYFTSELYFERWNGTAWEGLGSSATSGLFAASFGEGSTYTFATADVADNPVVGAVYGNYPLSTIACFFWNGASWNRVDPTSQDPYHYTPTVAWAPNGDLWLAVDNGNENNHSSTIALFQYSAGVWNRPAPNLTISGNSVSKIPSLAVDSLNRPVVAYMSGNAAGGYGVYVARWDGAQWEGLSGSNSGDGISDPATDAGMPGVIILPDDRIVVAYIQESTTAHWVAVKVFDGTSWTEFGTGSAVEPGIASGVREPVYTRTSPSQSNGEYPNRRNLSLAYDGADLLFCAWEDAAQSNIFGKVLNLNPTVPPATQYTYLYDSIDRLTGVQPNNGIRISYDYDPSGNREQKETTSQLVLSPLLVNEQNRAAANNQTNAPVFHARLDVNPEEDLTLDFLIFETSGSGNEATGISDARLWIDADESASVTPSDTEIGPTLSSFGDNGTLQFLNIGHTLLADTNSHLLVTYTFNGSPAIGDTFKLDLTGRTKIAATGASSGDHIYALCTPVPGPTVTITNDFAAPTFSGIDSANAQQGAVLLLWTPASDPSTPITYRVWQSTSPFGGTITAPPAYSTTNTTGLLVNNLADDTTYYFIARAEDAIGNRDTNTVERSATTLPAIEHTLTATGVNGYVDRTPFAIAYPAGATATLTAQPNDGYAFTSWSGDVPGGQEMTNPLTITMDADKTITALFSVANGNMNVNVTPDTATWTVVDSGGTPHPGAGDQSLTNLPAGAVEISWDALAGFLAPQTNPDIANVPMGGVLNLAGEYSPVLNFVAQPPALVKRYTGESANLSVSVTGGFGDRRYRWQFTSAAKSTTIVGGNSPVLALSNVAPSDSGDYVCEIEDDYPSTYSSNTTALVVADHLAIIQHPQDADKTEGDSHAFTVTTAGGIPPLSYTWYKDNIPIFGPTGPTYNLGLLTPEDSGVYTVTIADAHTDILTSNSALLTVQDTAATVPLRTLILLPLTAFVVGAIGVLLIRFRTPR